MKTSSSHNIKKDPYYEQRVEYAIKAHKNGCLIFSPQKKKLYTPREFVESGEEVSFSRPGLEDYINFTQLYPKMALEARIERVQKAQADLAAAEKELEDVIKKVLKAFKFIPRKKTYAESL